MSNELASLLESGPSQGLVLTTVAVLGGILILLYAHPTRHGAGKGNRGRPSRKDGVNHLPPEQRPKAFKPKKKYGKDKKKK